MSFVLNVNHSQRRLAADRLTVVTGGLELNGAIWESTWIDPITNTLMLRPRPLETEWYSESSGVYAKLGVADFDTDSAWEERQDQHWTGPWLAVKDAATNPAAISTASFPKNMGLSFSWFSYGAGDTFLQYELGWNSDATISGGVALQFWSDGRVDVHRNGEFIQSGKISGAKSREIRRLQVFEVMIIPMRKRELLIVSQSGDGFSVVFNDIDLTDSEPEITPAGKIWFCCQSGATQAQIAPIRYATSGYATSLKTSFLEAPQADEELVEFENDSWLDSPAPYKIYGFPGFSSGDQTVTASLVEWDGVAEFSPDGTANEIRVKLNLETTDDQFTPFVMGAQLGYAAIAGLTDGESIFDCAEFVESAVLSVPDRASGVVLDVALLRASELDDLASGGISAGRLPAQLRIDDETVLEGICGAMDVVHSSGNVARGTLEIRDRWLALEDAIFADRIPLDGLQFEQAIRLLVEKSGIAPERINVFSPGLKLPFSSGELSGEWGMLIESGDRASDWLRRLMETFAPSWFYGFRPAPDGSGEEFYALPITELDSEPAVTLYASREEAILDGVDESEASKLSFRSLTQASLEPVANEVRVTGIDPRTGRPLQSVKTDYAAQTVAATVGSRSDGWSGSIRRFALVDAGLTEQAAIDSACLALFDDLTVRKELVEFEADFLQKPSGVPIWRGDVVRIFGLGDVRIRSFGARFEFESSLGTYRRALYVGERL